MRYVPNPALAARKNGRFSIFFHIFSKIEQSKRFLPHISSGPIYQIKAHEIPSQMQKKSFRFNKKVCVGKNVNLGICSKFGGSFEGIGEILGNTAYWMEDPWGL